MGIKPLQISILGIRPLLPSPGKSIRPESKGFRSFPPEDIQLPSKSEFSSSLSGFKVKKCIKTCLKFTESGTFILQPINYVNTFYRDIHSTLSSIHTGGPIHPCTSRPDSGSIFCSQSG